MISEMDQCVQNLLIDGGRNEACLRYLYGEDGYAH